MHLCNWLYIIRVVVFFELERYWSECHLIMTFHLLMTKRHLQTFVNRIERFTDTLNCQSRTRMCLFVSMIDVPEKLQERKKNKQISRSIGMLIVYASTHVNLAGVS